MADHVPQAARLQLCSNEGLGELNVSLEAFFEFSFDLAEGLEDLVARWKQRAAPRDWRER